MQLNQALETAEAIQIDMIPGKDQALIVEAGQSGSHTDHDAVMYPQVYAIACLGVGLAILRERYQYTFQRYVQELAAPRLLLRINTR